jgi:hypothetical protein
MSLSFRSTTAENVHRLQAMDDDELKRFRKSASRSIALLIAVLCCIGFRVREAIAALR